LIPLRFEFANEFRPESRTTDRPPLRHTRVSIRGRPPAIRRISARGVTPKRGNNVASPLRRTPTPCPEKNWTDESGRRAGAPSESH